VKTQIRINLITQQLENTSTRRLRKVLITIRIGGSVIASPVEPQLVEQYIELLKKLKGEGHQILTVVGGGALARQFIDAGKQLGLDQQAQDKLAIHVSQLYALIFTLKLDKHGTNIVPKTISSALAAMREDKLVVMGGLKPGMTTDTVAALLAQKAKAQLLIKATDQNGIFTEDPKTHRDAKKLDRTTFQDLTKRLKYDRHKAGIHQILDPTAIKILQKTNTKTVVVNGYDPRNVHDAIQGKQVGTTITE
jgi:uridylate kinase